jgi:6-phosphogluconate dehydrogenase
MNKIGVIGLGVMGSNIIFNIFDKYTSNISCYDIDQEKIEKISKDIKNKIGILIFDNLKKFVESLEYPRKIMLFIPSGKYVDQLLDNLLPNLSENDNILDLGNEWYKNSELRFNRCKSMNIHFSSCGISGGEKGARNGACFMFGGDHDSYKIFLPLLSRISSTYDNESCVSYFGKCGNGNYIKMVHNGIEYAMMQLISEVYLIFKSKYQLNNEEIAKIFEKWNKKRLKSYLLEITIKILRKKENNDYILDKIKGLVESKGTGYMTVIDALEKKQPINIIFSALEYRNISQYKKEVNNLCIYVKKENIGVDIIDKIEKSLYYCILLSFYQGLNLISKHIPDINLNNLLKIWRNGCIIKCDMFTHIIEYYNKEYKDITEFVYSEKPDTGIIIFSDVSMITHSNCNQFLNNIFIQDSSGNLIQAMRDCFGGHTYELKDKNGKYHTEWEE